MSGAPMHPRPVICQKSINTKHIKRNNLSKRGAEERVPNTTMKNTKENQQNKNKNGNTQLPNNQIQASFQKKQPNQNLRCQQQSRLRNPDVNATSVNEADLPRHAMKSRRYGGDRLLKKEPGAWCGDSVTTVYPFNLKIGNKWFPPENSKLQTTTKNI